MFPTLLAIAGNPDVAKQLLERLRRSASKTFKVHLDGYNMVPYFTGKAKESPRQAIIYFSDDGEVDRGARWRLQVQPRRATRQPRCGSGPQPFVKLRLPTIINLRRDPFERADFNSNTYCDWMVDHVPQMYLMQKVVAEQIKDFELFPPRQKPASFNLDAVMAQVSAVPRPTATDGAHNGAHGDGSKTPPSTTRPAAETAFETRQASRDETRRGAHSIECAPTPRQVEFNGSRVRTTG